ncbi:MAG: hypothetical protein ACFFCO_01305 [Promethearchaeota archaeon]
MWKTICDYTSQLEMPILWSPDNDESTPTDSQETPTFLEAQNSDQIQRPGKHPQRHILTKPHILNAFNP